MITFEECEKEFERGINSKYDGLEPVGIFYEGAKFATNKPLTIEEINQLIRKEYPTTFDVSIKTIRKFFEELKSNVEDMQNRITPDMNGSHLPIMKAYQNVIDLITHKLED